MIDQRYTIAREYCGHPKAQWVVRFCGEWVDCADTVEEAREIRAAHRQAFLEMLEAA